MLVLALGLRLGLELVLVAPFDREAFVGIAAVGIAACIHTRSVVARIGDALQAQA